MILRPIWIALGLVLALLMAACSPSAPAPSAATPAGAAVGLTTFIFFYTDG